MLSTVCLLLPTRFVGPPRPSAKPFPSVDGSKRLLTCAGSHGQVVEGSQARTLIVTVTPPRYFLGGFLPATAHAILKLEATLEVIYLI